MSADAGDALAVCVPTDTRALVAVDLGAESCRVSLLRWVGGRATLAVVHRFSNGPVRRDDGLHWPLAEIVKSVEAGLAECVARAPEGIRSIAVDGWAVDYVRLDDDGEPLGEPFCYRDERSERAEALLHACVPAERMREITGVQQMALNTVYQLYADRLAGRVERRWLNLPEYLLHRWGGEPVAELTNATHTQLVDLHSRNWSKELFRSAGLELAAAPRIVPPGTLLGHATGLLRHAAALGTAELIAPACHDTASAIAGIAASGDDWAYISSGTWSLVGTVVRQPVNGPAARRDNFTNLGGVGGTTCFHKGVNGMWLLKQCQVGWAAQGFDPGIAALIEAAALLPEPAVLIDVDQADLLHMGDMPLRINRQLAGAGGSALDTTPAGAAAFVSLIVYSLAAKYADVLRRIEAHTGKTLRRVFIVGGGSQNTLLNRVTAQKTGLEVVCGSQESSTIGNFAVQLATLENEIAASDAAFADQVYRWAVHLNEPA